MKVSIVVPAYDMKGNGVRFLSHLLATVEAQDYKDVEVIVSDDSKEDEIEMLCKAASSKLDIKHVRHETQGRSSPNVNNAIRHASGDIIKVLFQDDFFIDRRALTMIVNEHKNGAKWVLAGCVHTNDGVNFYRYHVPSFNPKGYMGENLAGAPSLVSFQNDGDTFFDDSLAWLMDCEFYHRLFLKWGSPKIVPSPLTADRIWDGRVSSTVNEGVKSFEACYVWRKFND
jgi:glycosyltransferase involved in cell wall biosynthesis